MHSRHPAQKPPHGFTVIELLVTIAIIALLATLLFSALAGAQERGRRTFCASNIRQFLLAAHLYAQDNNDFLPRPEAFCTALIKNTTLTNFMRYAAVDRVLDCPNLHERFVRPSGWREQGPNSAIGYHYLGGQKSTPWPTNSQDAAQAWISPQKSSETSTADLLADLNSSYDRMTVVPHAKKRSVVVLEADYFQQHSQTLVFPPEVGAAGGNVGVIDGSVSWRDIKRMTMHPGGFQLGGAFLAWW